MRTTLNLDDQLVRLALRASGAKTKTEVIELGLRLLVEREARRRLSALAGRLPDLEPTPRRRS
ncbi:MAG: type II toxin-antitoxin system VapB family antitoxin [Polyangiaceae bacterium]|nr:type II toxin-antitoxin system VapB family antitoxin [Polyangiaceae bacterium]MCE7888989.1 type II toxin-antitoxin system VapB family antitoxin [Sorangiineae bacterium PRO1]MCL4750624.1 type II toxin-antitoxin system VapB family antitoxin [Myxococcales bacterium]